MASFRWIAAGALLIAVLAARGENAAAAPVVGIARAARRPPPRLRQRRRRLGRADGAERADGGARGDVAVLDGRHRGADGRRRSADARGASPGCSSASAASSRSCGRSIGVGAAGREFLGGVVAAQLACVGWAIGSTYARRHAREENVLAAAAFQMLFGGVFLFAGRPAARRVARPRVQSAHVGGARVSDFFGAIGGFSAYALRAEAPADRDRVALRLRQPGDRRDPRHACFSTSRSTRGRRSRRRWCWRGSGWSGRREIYRLRLQIADSCDGREAQR